MQMSYLLSSHEVSQLSWAYRDTKTKEESTSPIRHLVLMTAHRQTTMDAVLDGGVGDSRGSVIVTCHACPNTGGRQDVPVFAMVEFGGY